jgi:hypothetical protein
MKTLMHKRGNLLRGNQRVLTVSLLLATLAACQKNVEKPIDAASSEEQVSTKATSGGDLIWHENADGSSFLTGGGVTLSIQTSTTYGITASTLQHYNGTKSVRFELRDTDPESHSGTRAEISFPMETSNNYWYSYALYMPSAEYKDEPDDEVISQWHQGGGTSPGICMNVTNGHLNMRTPDNTRTDLGPIEKDRWHTYVYHIIHSAGSDGLIEIWKDGVKIITRKGPSMYPLTNGFTMPNWKMGVYKSDWNGTKTTSTNLRVLYFDDIKYGKSTATYDEMLPTGSGTTSTTSPTSGTTTTTNTSISVSSFTLVNSSTEKEVKTITDGSSLSLSSLGIKTANIRAITSGTIANVKFELSGTQSKTSTDAAAPYALMGDDGNGNYYFGNWAPPALGTYTLKATPYDSKGVAGVSKTITFTFVK